MFTTNQPIKQQTLEAIVIRKDGTREDLGTIAYWNINPLRRLAWRLSQRLRGSKAGQIITTRTK